MNLKKNLENQEVKASVPCRVDLGGTLDISTFFLPLSHLNPATFNIALDMRTTVKLSPWRDGFIKISSKGFESAEFEADRAPFNHPMGLMFAVARFFNADGVHVEIKSSSPPRSALGGSSAAAVAMVAAFKSVVSNKSTEPIDPAHTALIAHSIESSVAGVPCGLQDQLAAAYGGINCWHWSMGKSGISFKQEPLIDEANSNINLNILVSYCGIPHVSSDINSRWVKSFLKGENRDKWHEIIKITQDFSKAVKCQNFTLAASLMNQESQIRLEMTPDVFDKTGLKLFESAKKNGCGARFTGAGGGGCIWAIGEKVLINSLRYSWQEILDKVQDASLLDTLVDFKGIQL
ncbi:MAG: galactokinase [Desulfamplus sp.]|nr:galactokinase [Desulfamplus sp.]